MTIELSTNFPNVRERVDGLKSFHAEVEQKYLHLGTGRSINEPMKTKWSEREANLKSIVGNYNSNAKLDFLRKIEYFF